MYNKELFWLPYIATLVAAALVLHWFVFCKRKIPIAPTVTDDNHAEASALSPTADSVAVTGEYEVFLSFCGKDTRKGFTDFLYTYLVGACIPTFRDENELRVGEEIGPELLKSIQESKISIPILSKNYASSKWCLLELQQIVECHENGGHKIYPVFYDVEPSDVQNQRGDYEAAFSLHEQIFDQGTIRRWREALKKVGTMKGLELNKETDGRQGELVKIIVENVLFQLQKNYTHVPEKLVGCGKHIEKLMALLEIGSQDVRIVGIHGMGGLGKTTISKIIYNQLFDRFQGYCFLDDVRENSKHHNGIVDLQKQLIKSILNSRVVECFSDDNQGRSRIKDVVYGKKLLIVLDDIDDNFQVDKLIGHQSWFGSQTRIILTTRNKDVLDVTELNCQSEYPCVVYKSYNPHFLNSRDSLQLFCNYAFKRDSPIEEYDILAKKVVSIAGGLPLVLVVLGSAFFPMKDKDLWEEKLRQLQKIPTKEVVKKLKFSFEALDQQEKQIFLDIACLFIGRDKTKASYMWEDCNFYPRLGIRVLINRSLIKIGDDNKFLMHDQLRDLGRQIVNEESLNKLENQSRLWDTEEAMQILSTHQGTSSLNALILYSYQYSIVASQFRNLFNLRFLSVVVNNVDGNFEGLLTNLRWLECKYSGKFLPINLNMKNLVVLTLSSIDNLTEDWEGWNQLKMAKKLKFLHLSWCRKIRVLPDLSIFASLEILKLGNCRSLCRLDGLQLLKSLRQLKLMSCNDLVTLPNLSCLTKLVELYLSGCYRLIEISGLEKLESLEILCINFCSSLKTLPNISNLKNLKEFKAAGCSELIDIVGLHRLNSLEHLSLNECEILQGVEDLSNLNRLQVLRAPGLEKTDFSNFKRLKRLEILRSNLMGLQDLNGLNALEDLCINECISFKRLHDLAYLRRLKKIKILNCDQLIEIQGIDRLESLRMLKISNCQSLERLPNLSNSRMLISLKVSYCNKLQEVKGVGELKSLESLVLSDCSSIEALPDLSNLQKLKDLDVSGCVNLTEIRGLEKLKSLSKLDICGCEGLEYLPDSPKVSVFRGP